METPLLSSHAKMIPSRSNKKRFILDRYVVCDQGNGRARFSPANSGPNSSSSTAELTKSHSTPASLQAVVEFNENSTNSLQHRVIIICRTLLSSLRWLWCCLFFLMILSYKSVILNWVRDTFMCLNWVQLIILISLNWVCIDKIL